MPTEALTLQLLQKMYRKKRVQFKSQRRRAVRFALTWILQGVNKFFLSEFSRGQLRVVIWSALSSVSRPGLWGVSLWPPEGRSPALSSPSTAQGLVAGEWGALLSSLQWGGDELVMPVDSDGNESPTLCERLLSSAPRSRLEILVFSRVTSDSCGENICIIFFLLYLKTALNVMQRYYAMILWYTEASWCHYKNVFTVSPRLTKSKHICSISQQTSVCVGVLARSKKGSLSIKPSSLKIIRFMCI